MSTSSESTITTSMSGEPEPEPRHYREVIFPAGNSDFRAVRNRCARACREFNKTPDDAHPELRSQRWLDIVRPDRDRTEDSALAITHDQTFANPTLKARTPFVKPPVYVDYGVRLHVGGSTFINRNCTIMDTPVADVVIGERCNIGPNCVIVGVTHPTRLDERLQRNSVGQPVTIGDDVWIGANVTILGNVTIGSGSVIGAGSLVKRNIPPMSVAFGVPARVVAYLRDVKPTPPGSAPYVSTLDEAMALGNRLGMVHGSEQDGDGKGVVVGLDTPVVVDGQVGGGGGGLVRRGRGCGGGGQREEDEVEGVSPPGLELLDMGLLADDVPVAAEAHACRLPPRRAFGLVSPAPTRPISPSLSPPAAGMRSRAGRGRDAEGHDDGEERPRPCRCAHNGGNSNDHDNNNNNNNKIRDLLRLRSPRGRQQDHHPSTPRSHDDHSQHESDDDDDNDARPGDPLLHRAASHRHRHRHRCRRFDVEAVAVATVGIAVLLALFFAGVYLGASASASGGGNHRDGSTGSGPGLGVGADM
ncbi:hypothetical protein VTJ49DRAFT_6582 [Mycothermus thermophilus]|uniref:Mannose-1-phosphate guanylyltransferase n=1 Tax=Humicola insolens TaxID=85995 RepID=A0ABR3V1C7_HUMIN